MRTISRRDLYNKIKSGIIRRAIRRIFEPHSELDPDLRSLCEGVVPGPSPSSIKPTGEPLLDYLSLRRVQTFEIY
jgi:hypothetical protein